MDYYGLLVSGKGVSQTIGSGDRAFDTTVMNKASLRVSSGGYIENTTAHNNTSIYNAGSADSTVLSAGTMFVSRGGVANGVRIVREGKVAVSSGGTALDLTIVDIGIVTAIAIGGDSVTRIDGVNRLGSFYLSDGVASNFLINSLGQLQVSNGGLALDPTVSFGGFLTVLSGGTALGVTVSRGGHIGFSLPAGDRSTLISGVNELGTFGLSAGVASNFLIADGFDSLEIRSGGTMCHTVISGVQSFLRLYSGAVATATSAGRNGCFEVNDGGSAFDTVISSGGSMKVCDGARVSGVQLAGVMTVQSGLAGADESGGRAVLDGIVVSSGGVLSFSKNAVLSGGMVVGGTMNVASGIAVEGGSAEVRVVSGGVLNVGSQASIGDAVLEAGASLTLANDAGTGSRLTLDFSGAEGDRAIYVNDLSLVGAATAVSVTGLGTSGTYSLGSGATGNESFTLISGNGNDYAMDGTLTSVVDAFTGRVCTTSADGGVLKITAAAGSHTIAETAAAEALISGGTALNGADREARWTADTAVAAGVGLASGMTDGNAWLEIDGYAGGDATTLYGTAADQAFGGAVNLKLKSGGLRNLAGGAAAGGSVKAVNLFCDGATLNGVGYAGGFGTVTGATVTTVGAGTFAKDFYAGALANKNTTPTSVGDVVMTVAGGAFSGNIYGASAVKTDHSKGNDLRHAAGDVTLTVTGGATTKGANACIFAGGLAAGDATGTVYTVASVTAEISGGSWGAVKGGRGVFGGVMASGVAARTGDVTLTVSGGTMGNVFGGGWAQNGATSEVGDVNLTITGDAQVANVFGGGSHSTSDGSTAAGNVTITVSGGSIANAVCARGHLAGDTVESAEVIFTGANDYGCDVFGYGGVGSTDDSDATLYFADYSGMLSGGIGGFERVTLSGDTRLKLAPAAGRSVAENAWVFDVTERTAACENSALLDWTGSFAASDLKLKVGAENDVEWTLVSGVESYKSDGFAVEIAGGGTYYLEFDAASGRTDTLGGAGYTGALENWGFALEDTTLKFRNLA